MFKAEIHKILKQVVDKEYHDFLDVLVPSELAHGDYSTNIAMILASKLKKNPREIAQEIVSKIGKLGDHSLIEKTEIAGAGYINFFLKPEAYTQVVQKILSSMDSYGDNSTLKNKKIMVEYGHPNPFKVMHIGHLRNFCIGESICRLLESSGASVIRTNYQGDVGMHVAKCIWALRKKVGSIQNDLTVDQRVKLLSDCYVEGAKAFEESEASKKEIVEINKRIYTEKTGEIHELWKLGVQWSLDKFHELYARLYTHFEREYLESETLEKAAVENKIAQEKGILVKSKGAIVFDGTPYKLDTRVFLNSEGLPTYEGKELGLARMEFSDFGHIDLCVHNVAVEQKSFFQVTFKVEELLDPALYKDKQYHNAYEFVGLKSGKMSSRKGQVVTAESILDEAHAVIEKVVTANDSSLPKEDIDAIAIAAVKYSFLKMSAFKYLAFDMESSVSMSGDSGPYIQYTYARCQSVLKKSKKNTPATVSAGQYNDEELKVMKLLSQFPEMVETATKNYDPHFVAVHINTIAQAFNTFYNKHSILNGEDMDRRIGLTAAVAQVLKKGLYLLGIKAVEKM